AGSDWAKIYVRDIENNVDLEDELDWVKFSGASWWKDGFFYSRYPEPAPGAELSAQNQFHSVYYHEIGTPQSEDKLIFTDQDNPKRFHNVGVTKDKKYAIMSVSEGTDNFETWYAKLEEGKEIVFQPLFTGFEFK